MELFSNFPLFLTLAIAAKSLGSSNNRPTVPFVPFLPKSLLPLQLLSSSFPFPSPVFASLNFSWLSKLLNLCNYSCQQPLHEVLAHSCVRIRKQQSL